MKKNVCIILCILMISACAVISASAMGEYPYKLYDPALDSQKFPQQVYSGSCYGQRVIVNAPFDAVAFCMPTWNSTNSSASIGVFEWADDFDTTINQKPKYEKALKRLRDCAVNTLTFDAPLPAGEYFFAIYNTEGSVGIWRYPMTKSQGYVYLDGVEQTYDLEITVYFTKKTDNPVSRPVSSLKLTAL